MKEDKKIPSLLFPPGQRVLARQSLVSPDNVQPGAGLGVFKPRTIASSQLNSSSQDDDFVIAPCPRRATRKAIRRGDTNSFQADEEGANIVERHAVRETREERESELI
jgi:hypothetical protein